MFELFLINACKSVRGFTNWEPKNEFTFFSLCIVTLLYGYLVILDEGWINYRRYIEYYYELRK